MAKVSRIAVARLFNLGRYEHVRYEVGVDLSPDDDAGATLEALSRHIEAIGPVSEEIRQAGEWGKRMLSKPAGEITNHDVANLEHYKLSVAKLDAANTARKEALLALSAIGAEVNRKHSEPKPIEGRDEEELL